MLPYDLVKELNFYISTKRDNYWMEVVPQNVKEVEELDFKNLLPANLICSSTFYLKVGKKFFDDKFKVLQ